MNIYEKLFFIKQYTDSVGEIYGTEDFSVYLYSLIKMRKPKRVVELGTGLGSVMLWSALAVEENKVGLVYTVDNGSEWSKLKQAKPRMGPLFREQYVEYVNNLINNFEFNNYISFINSNISIDELPDDIDILFSDFAHGPRDIMSMLVDILPKLSDTSILMFDSASTYYSSYLTLNELVKMLNRGYLPTSLSASSELLEKIRRCSFELRHIVEAKDRAQNSTACIHIQPKDIFPYPLSHMRF